MKKTWSIPAKTFLLGEYVAIAGEAAILLTTSPFFELTLTGKPGLHGIHPESPAGKWWLEHGQVDVGLQWHDPYQGRGGMGASSAQFLGAYLASQQSSVSLLDAYFQSAWQGAGLRPSGYDVLAQSQTGCVVIDRQKGICQSYPWPFKDLDFLLLHTGQKLATHHHLQTAVLPSHLTKLTSIVDNAKMAFETKESQGIVDAVNAYHHQLARMDLVANYSMQCIASLKKQPDIVAIKGCGAMGADVLLVITQAHQSLALHQHLFEQGWHILATSKNLYTGVPLIENIF